jgi:predicted amidophosphoribosyltransferase
MFYKDTETDIYYFSDYVPYRIFGERNPNFTKDTGGRILDLKDSDKNAIDYYCELIMNELKEIFQKHNDISVAVVPSHDPNKFNSGIRCFVSEFARRYNLIDANTCLVRYKLVEKLAHGGDRSIETHLNSIRVENVKLIKGKKVFVIDDVTTSGNSLLACKKLLEDAGAYKVLCIALAKTKH